MEENVWEPKEMLYWKTVDAGDFKTYSKKFLEYYTKNNNFGHDDCSFRRYDNTFWNELKQEKMEEVFNLIPEMRDAFSKFGEVKEIAILFLWENEYGSLHTDHTTGLNNGVEARLQIPVLNTEGSRTAYFELNEREFKNHKVNEGGTRIWPEFYRQKIKPVTYVELLEPAIIRTNVPHTVYCDTNKYPRITMTVSFKEDLVKYLDEV